MTLAPNSEPQERARSMPEAKWYIVHAYSNFEKKVAATIREQAERKGLTHLIEEIEVPTEEVVEVARGKKKTVEKRYFPGYVLMKAQLTDDIYHLVKDTPKVSGFLGAEGGKKPCRCASAKWTAFLASRPIRRRSARVRRSRSRSASRCRSTMARSRASRARSRRSTRRMAA